MEKRLTQVQLELIRLKQNLIQQTLQQLQADYQSTIALIASELGILNLSDWRFTGESFVYKGSEEDNGQQKLNFNSKTD